MVALRTHQRIILMPKSDQMCQRHAASLHRDLSELLCAESFGVIDIERDTEATFRSINKSVVPNFNISIAFARSLVPIIKLTLPVVLLAATSNTLVSALGYGFDTFSQQPNCVDFQEYVHITQSGSNKGNLSNGRRRLQIIHPDNRCKILIYDGNNEQGNYAGYFENLGMTICFGFADGREIKSFNVVCQ